ncbi:hypothetical protein BT96DRAFT_396040 [Gymnopus androsaceus JB14]|uniref:Uncharacterized protein n=1 Tax=Gymnopus androsaceus JB14 TaxID=1447944 RepID=A0A6A4HZI7_9AGAR|nr:hypothetical protein BT96DRAFT_396040 [Gymnopus androsaceus JB14]
MTMERKISLRQFLLRVPNRPASPTRRWRFFFRSCPSTSNTPCMTLTVSYFELFSCIVLILQAFRQGAFQVISSIPTVLTYLQRCKSILLMCMTILGVCEGMGSQLFATSESSRP